MGNRAGWRVGVQGSIPQGRAKHQGQYHLAVPSRRPAHPRTVHTTDHPDLNLKKCHTIGLSTVGPMLTLVHRRWARWLRLRPRRHHNQRDAKGRVQTGRYSAWVCQEQLWCSWHPPAHFREAPTRRYSGCPQPFPLSAGSPDAHVMLLGRKSPTAAPHWKDKSI